MGKKKIIYNKMFTLEDLGRIIIAKAGDYPTTEFRNKQKVGWFYIYQLVEQELKELNWFKDYTNLKIAMRNQEEIANHAEAVQKLKEVTKFLQVILDWVPVANQLLNVAEILQDYML